MDDRQRWEAVAATGRCVERTVEALEKIEDQVDALSRVVSALAAKTELSTGLSEDYKIQLETDLDAIKRPVGAMASHIRMNFRMDLP